MKCWAYDMTSIRDILELNGINIEKIVGGMTKNETAPTKEGGSFVINSGTKNAKVAKVNG